MAGVIHKVRNVAETFQDQMLRTLGAQSIRQLQVDCPDAPIALTVIGDISINSLSYPLRKIATTDRSQWNGELHLVANRQKFLPIGIRQASQAVRLRVTELQRSHD